MKRLIFLILILVVIFIGCQVTDDPINGGNDNPGDDQVNEPTISETYQSECKDTLRTDDNGVVEFLVDGYDVIINHYDAYRNCGMIVDFQMDFDGSTIKVTENNVGEYAYCMCYFDFSVTITDLSPGDYHIELWGVDDFGDEFIIAEEDITIN
jgi:hypothetical protein